MSEFIDPKFILHRIKFSIFIILVVPAFTISILLFLYFKKHQHVLKILQNQALLVLLIVNFTELLADLPMPISFYYLGYIFPATSAYCTWWTFFEYNLHLISELLMATISVQRHLLIFNLNIFQNRLKRWLLYYFPLALCIIYPIIFYIIIIYIYPCDGTQWDYTSNLCGYANCYLVYNKFLASYDWAANNGFPVLVIILANSFLVIRVIAQKRRQQQGLSWRKQRRMTVQLLLISSLYLVAWLPSLTIGVGQQIYSAMFLANIQIDYTLDFMYFVSLLSPWIYLGLLPHAVKWIMRHRDLQNPTRNTVRPL